MKLYIITALILCLSCNGGPPSDDSSSDDNTPDASTPGQMTGKTYHLAANTHVSEVHTAADLVGNSKYINVDTNRSPHYFTCQRTGQLNAESMSLIAGSASQRVQAVHLRIVCTASDAAYLNSTFAAGINASYLQVLMDVVQNKADSLCLGVQLSTEIDTDEAYLSLLHSSTSYEEIAREFDCRASRNEITVIISPVYSGLYYAHLSPKIITIARAGFVNPTILLHEIGHTFDLEHPVCVCNLCSDLSCHFMYPRLTGTFCPAQVMIQDWLQMIAACDGNTLCSPCSQQCGGHPSAGDCWDCPLPTNAESVQTDTTGIFIRSRDEFRHYANPEWRDQTILAYAQWQSRNTLDFYEERFAASLLHAPAKSNQFQKKVPEFFRLEKFSDVKLMKRINPNLTSGQIDSLRETVFN